MFKYRSHFQTGCRPPGRTYGMSYHADHDLCLGDPTGEVFQENGVYQRRFTKGLATVAPMHRGGGKIELRRRYFSPEGKLYEGAV